MITKDEPRWRSGIWLGFIDHTNEHIIGTRKGVVKCRAIRRNDASDQFNAKMIEEMKGTPRRPVPGRDSLKIPTNICENGAILDENGKQDGYAEENENLEERFNPGIDVEQDEEFRKIINEQEERKRNSQKTVKQFQWDSRN